MSLNLVKILKLNSDVTINFSDVLMEQGGKFSSYALELYFISTSSFAKKY